MAKEVATIEGRRSEALSRCSDEVNPGAHTPEPYVTQGTERVKIDLGSSKNEGLDSVDPPGGYESACPTLAGVAKRFIQ